MNDQQKGIRIKEVIENEDSKTVIDFFELNLPVEVKFKIVSNEDGLYFFTGSSIVECLDNLDQISLQTFKDPKAKPYFLNSHIEHVKIYPDFEKNRKHFPLLWDCFKSLCLEYESLKEIIKNTEFFKEPWNYDLDDFQETIFYIVANTIRIITSESKNYEQRAKDDKE